MLLAAPIVRNCTNALSVGLSVLFMLTCLLAAPQAAQAQGEKKVRVPLQSLTAKALHNRLQRVLRRQIATLWMAADRTS